MIADLIIAISTVAVMLIGFGFVTVVLSDVEEEGES